MLNDSIKLAFDDSLNCENRLVKILRNKQRIYFLYDYMGRRVDTKIYDLVSGNWVLTKHKKFVYNRYKLIKEIELLANTSMQFVWLGDTLLALEANGTAYNYLADGNKNITQLINLTTGTTANHYDYTPFGKLINEVESVANQFKFSSEYHDETGLVYYNYRYYNPQTGKWLTRDPLGEFVENNFLIKRFYNLNNKQIVRSKNKFNPLYGFIDNKTIGYFDNIGLSIWSWIPGSSLFMDPKDAAGAQVNYYKDCINCKKDHAEKVRKCQVCIDGKAMLAVVWTIGSSVVGGVFKGFIGWAAGGLSGGAASAITIGLTVDAAADVINSIDSTIAISEAATKAKNKYCGTY